MTLQAGGTPASTWTRAGYNIGMMDTLRIAGRELQSRLIVGTGKYKSFQENARALEASGADMVTVAVRREKLVRHKESLLDFFVPIKTIFIPTTAVALHPADRT